ncbi:MAG TPA: gephyrin-like molybdotransferase Glp, partial [Candidatus Binatia bacterium]|nr:gephyrin-like molybdotransferase Glp [Candidatus Binatia bacterium]
MSGFLQRKPLPVARELILAGVEPLAAEEIAVEEAAGRVTAEEVVARHPAPHYQASAMDGIAVRAADTYAASAGQPVTLEVWNGDGDPPADAVVCRPVDTGSLLPPWADAVVRIEEARATGSAFQVRTPSPPGRDVRRAGEDIEAGTVLLPAGSRLRAYDIGALLATGVHRVSVRRRPSVGILATGTEVVEPDRSAGPGQVIEYNSRVIAALVQQWGGQPVRLGIFADQEDALLGALDQARRSFDVVCAIAGSSAGRKDLTITALQQVGEVLVHGVDIAPGRPVAVARIGATPVLAVPGYPVAAVVACEQLLQPLLARLLGTTESGGATVEATVARKIVSRTGIEEFRRVCLARGDSGYVAAPLPQSAGSISTIAGAHGWLRIAPEVEGVDAGSAVTIELMVTQV